jgi:hypothetical protein
MIVESAFCHVALLRDVTISATHGTFRASFAPNRSEGANEWSCVDWQEENGKRTLRTSGCDCSFIGQSKMLLLFAFAMHSGICHLCALSISDIVRQRLSKFQDCEVI